MSRSASVAVVAPGAVWQAASCAHAISDGWAATPWLLTYR